MRKPLIAIALAATAGSPALAFAQAAPAAAPQSPHTLTGNVALVSSYRFRGIDQTFGKPALQGGVDYSHASGFYAGNWNSNVNEG
ncbi:MAG TPA: TorF family putative porin, partial [Burkholderiales bacterium]|nr:TorF family putative porin [Burkholderiales bacterium]